MAAAEKKRGGLLISISEKEDDIGSPTLLLNRVSNTSGERGRS